jgi:protein-S-isoprenylcysteine O-methyltransferase Ste14
MTRLLPILALVLGAAALTVAVGYALSGTGAVTPALAAGTGAVILALALLVRVWGRRS